MPNNFGLYKPLQNAELRILRPGDTTVREDEIQTDHYGLVSIDLVASTNAELEYYWEPFEASPSVLGGVEKVTGIYLSGFSGYMPYQIKIRIVGEPEADTGAPDWPNNTAPVANDDFDYTPVGDHIFLDVDETYKFQSVIITLYFDAGATGTFYMHPPIICGEDLGELVSYGYSNGRTYNFAGSVSYQDTKTMRFPQSNSSFDEKEFKIELLSESEQESAVNFLRSNLGRLCLMKEYQANNKNDFTAGWLSAGQNISNFYELGEVSLSITSKFAR